MKTTSRVSLAVVVLLIIALVGLLLSRQPALSDQDQIGAQIEAVRAAAQSHNVSGIMNIVSADFKGSDPISNVDSLHLVLQRGLGKTGTIYITLSPPSVVVHGDMATSTSQVIVKDSETSQFEINQPLTLSWRREDGRRFLVFPVKVWRVVGAQFQGDWSGFD